MYIVAEHHLILARGTLQRARTTTSGRFDLWRQFGRRVDLLLGLATDLTRESVQLPAGAWQLLDPPQVGPDGSVACTALTFFQVWYTNEEVKHPAGWRWWP